MSAATPDPRDAPPARAEREEGADREMRACPVCGGPRSARASIGTNAEARWNLEVCDRCGHGVLHPAPSDEELQAAYASAYGEDGAKFRPMVERAVRAGAAREAAAIAARLPSACRRVLDVGCGRGVLLGALVESGIEAEGVERSADAARGIDARVLLHVAPDLERARLMPGSYGAVVFRHVLEHLRDPAAALRAARRLVHPEGFLLVEVPDFGSRQARVLGRHWFHLDPPRHLHHFTETSLRQAVTSAGFVIDEVQHGAALQDVMGWLQGALHAAGRPHMGLYDGLHAGHRAPFPDLVGGVLLGPAALGASLVERLAGGGATVGVRATPGR
jgi:2-polyprenyl-3-methyl-5-hydroxy-6-metoxy-1,4-benzoquinol methylase